MGFETWFSCQYVSIYLEFELCPYGIWNSGWVRVLFPISKIWTLSLWDLKPLKSEAIINLSSIWTLSLWDLKLTFHKQESDTFTKFELCPYGIWNFLLSHPIHPSFHLNFVPMGFETLGANVGPTDLVDLNFVPMGFETLIGV